MMKQEYQKYIDKILHRDAWGHCKQQCEKMNKQFPELIPAKGWYFDAIWNEEREHHWLKTSDGEIIDPTAIQFPTKGMTNYYTEYKKGDAFKIGKCAYCGNDIVATEEDIDSGKYIDLTVCSEECHKAYVAYLFN